jgi:hypothetical protein
MQGTAKRRMAPNTVSWWDLVPQVSLVSDGADGKGKWDVVQSDGIKGGNRRWQGGKWCKAGVSSTVMTGRISNERGGIWRCRVWQ